jgi:hypothetical protein
LDPRATLRALHRSEVRSGDAPSMTLARVVEIAEALLPRH